MGKWPWALCPISITSLYSQNLAQDVLPEEGLSLVGSRHHSQAPREPPLFPAEPSAELQEQ